MHHTARQPPPAALPDLQRLVRRFLDNLQYLIGHADQQFVLDVFDQISHRREWVQEREAHERQRRC